MRNRSRFRVRHKAILLLVFGLWSKQVMAHDPGLSTTEIKVDRNGGVTLEMAFAPADAQRISLIDSNGDQKISPAEFEQAKSGLLKTAIDEVELHSDNERLTPLEQSASYDVESSVVVIRLGFSERVGRHFELKSGIMRFLARGHKQFVTLRDQDGQIVSERMLGLGDDRLTYDFRSQKGANRSFREFLILGVEHILTGYDHLAFLLALLLVGGSLRSAAKVISSFTLAHSVTLALATFRFVQVPSHVVEPLIAASIVYVGVENLVRGHRPNRWLLTFLFGLVHGLGFASVLRDLGIAHTASSALVPLLSFNMGVELGQLGIAVLVVPLVWKLKRWPKFDLRYVPACSAAIAVVGCYWLFQRTLT
ncbi:MAG TPA: HupE/UreJ family protein [Pyrinomonadaceae bacterium]